MHVITTHLNADFDAFASMVAAKKLYPEAVLVFPGAQEKNIRDFFVHSQRFSFEVKRVRQIELKDVHRLIIVDTRQARRIGRLAECLENPGIEVHLFDHHPDTPEDLKGDYQLVRPLGSTSAIFVELFMEKGVSLSREEATLMLMGIYEDTGSFSFATTTPADLRAAAWLLEQGADLQVLPQFISHELTAHQVSLLHDLISSAVTYAIHGIEVVVARLNLPEYVDEFALLVRRFIEMENLDTLIALVGMEDRIYFIGRSRIPEVNVGEIARDLGGGGHASAASATIRDMTMFDAEERLLRLLHKHVRPRAIAGELMSSPAITVPPDTPIRVANEVLTRYSITVLPVVQDKKQVLGMISRMVIEKAIFHGLGDLPVADYMTSDVATLPATATLSDIQELIIEHRQRLIPVTEGDELIGVITRTDLLSVLVNDPALLPKDLLRVEERPSVERNRNLNSLMVEHLGRDIILLLRTIGEVAGESHCTAYVVGGFVRDLLLRVKNFDIDVVVEGNGIAFARKLAEHFKGEVRTHEKFNTAVVKLPDGRKIDVATARLEYYEYPAAMPVVELSSIKLDLYRRDFTINAMAIHLNPARFGTLVDFFNCQNDIKERRIRILHNLSFVEDPTRIFRAIRFEQRMGFTIGNHTEKLLKNAVRMNLFDRFQGGRCLNEIRLILSEEDPVPALRRMAGFDLLRFLRPELRFDRSFEKLLGEIQKAVAWHRLLYLDEPCQPWLVYLLAIMVQAPAEEVEAFCQRYEVPERFAQVLRREKAEGERVALFMNRSGRQLRPSEIYWLLHDRSHEGLLFVMALARRKSSKKAVSLFVTTLRHVRPELRGGDLLQMGYRPGPHFGAILDHLLEARLDGQVKSRAEEEEFVRRHYPPEKMAARGGEA